MASRTDARCTWAAGALTRGAFIDVRLFGKADRVSKEALTKAMFAAMRDMLEMNDGDVYVNIFEMDSWAGATAAEA